MESPMEESAMGDLDKLFLVCWESSCEQPQPEVPMKAPTGAQVPSPELLPVVKVEVTPPVVGQPVLQQGTESANKAVFPAVSSAELPSNGGSTALSVTEVAARASSKIPLILCKWDTKSCPGSEIDAPDTPEAKKKAHRGRRGGIKRKKGANGIKWEPSKFLMIPLKYRLKYGITVEETVKKVPETRPWGPRNKFRQRELQLSSQEEASGVGDSNDVATASMEPSVGTKLQKKFQQSQKHQSKSWDLETQDQIRAERAARRQTEEEEDEIGMIWIPSVALLEFQEVIQT